MLNPITLKMIEDIRHESAAQMEAIVPEFPKFRRFILVRDEDVSGVSGTGIVVQGCQFEDGKAVMRWVSETSSIAVYESIEDIIKIHVHNGATRLVWVD
jgi:hypothetical protein